MKFLSAGRSFVGLGSGPACYQATAASVVPNFSKKSYPRGGKRPAQGPDTHQHGHVGTVGDSVSPAKLKVKATALPLASAAAVGAATPAASRKESRLLAAPTAAIVAEPPAMQTELRLAKVKVARNDLSDADLEVVATPVPPPPPDAPSGQAESFVKQLKMTHMVRACLAWF